MARIRMNWDWVGDVPVAVYTTWIDKAHFKVSLRKGRKEDFNRIEEDGLRPQDPVWFEYERKGLWSHDEVVQDALLNAQIKINLQVKEKEKETAPKYDDGKQKWHAMPLTVLKGLADVFEAGAEKYEKFSCLKRFENSDARFWDAMNRHLEECQIDPLAIDEETGCLHGYQAAWNILMRTYHAQKEKES